MDLESVSKYIRSRLKAKQIQDKHNKTKTLEKHDTRAKNNFK